MAIIVRIPQPMIARAEAIRLLPLLVLLLPAPILRLPVVVAAVEVRAVAEEADNKL